MTIKSKILDIEEIEKKLKRLAWQVYEKNADAYIAEMFLDGVDYLLGNMPVY